jgi:gluconolactonase
VIEIDFVEVGPDLAPGERPNRTYDVVPHAEDLDADRASDPCAWRSLAPEQTMQRLGSGRVSFAWYTIEVTVPARIDGFDPTGATAVFECTVDDYAEVWVDGRLDRALGQAGGAVVGGFNVPNRVVLTRDARPGQSFRIAVFGMNGPISASPSNYIWLRNATVDFYGPDAAATAATVKAGVRRLDAELTDVLGEAPAAERIATGFEFTDGPLWSADGTLLFSSPNTNTVYRWSPPGRVDVFRSKSGYSGVDIARYHQPGANGLAFDPRGRLVICQHGNRRVIRVEPRGNVTVLADRFGGRRLNSPHDVVVTASGSVVFTDPPFGLPGGARDATRELEFGGLYVVQPGSGRLDLVCDELSGPDGLALSPDEDYLYVGNADREHAVVVRFPIERLPSGDLDVGEGEVFADLTNQPGREPVGGIDVDRAGRVFVCGPGGIWVFAPDGRRLGLVDLPEGAHDLTWGDADRGALYVTAETSVYRLQTATAGPTPPLQL